MPLEDSGGRSRGGAGGVGTAADDVGVNPKGFEKRPEAQEAVGITETTCRLQCLFGRAGATGCQGWASKRIFAQSKATTNPTTSRTPVECAAAVLSGPEGGAAACCFMIFAWTGEALRQEIPAGKFQKMDKSFIDIKDFDVDELGPFPKCHEHFGEHLVRNGGADQWAKNSDVPRGGPYPPGHPENPEWLSKSASSSKQAGDRFGQLQAQVQLVLLPALCVMLASKQSLWLFTSEQASGTVTPVLEQQDAYWLPVLGSGALFGLFVVIKFLGHDWLKHAITTVMVWVSAFGVASNIDTVTYLVRNKRGCFVSFAQLEISPANVFGMPAAAALAVAYVSTGHWIVNNILGFSFCLLGIRSINLSSYGAGVVLLSGLFVYDVFWVFFSKPVFGANVMVSVAKGVEAPIKLMLPRDFGGCGDLQFNMLGLGDIAVPGLFAAFLAKWDAVNMAAGSSKSFVYLNCCLLAYMLSLVLTVTVMMIFQHAQPALLYICTCVLLASLAVAHARGELRDLIAFSIPEDAEAEEGIQSASSDADKKESTSSCFSCLQVLQRLKGVSSYFFPAMAAAMAGPTCEKVTVRMMSGDVMEIPALGTLADLRQIIAQSAQTCPEFVRLLRGEDVLDEGIDVGSLANREVSALVTPSVPNLLKALRQHDFNFRGLNERSTSASKVRGLNVLHAAVMTGKLDMIRFTLLEEDFHGTNDTCSDGSGYTALHLAASRGLVDVCLELLACPQVTHQNAHSVKDGTALHVAAQGGHVAVVLALLDSESFTAVNEVVVADQWRQDWRERYGQTALHVAARSGCKDAAKMLLDHPRFTSVLAYTKAFKDAEKMAEEARQTEIALMIRNHPKANSQNGPAVGQGGPPAKFHQFAPGNPYLVTVMPLLVNLGSACAPAHEAAESKHIITQDSWRLVKIEPEVQDIADHFGLDERITGKLQEALNTRPDPGTDLQVMWEILDEARNPPGLTMIKVKEMLEGTFRAGEQKDARMVAEVVGWLRLFVEGCMCLESLAVWQCVARDEDFDKFGLNIFWQTSPEVVDPSGLSASQCAMSAAARLPVAERHAECPLSFVPLYKGPVAVFLDAAGKRVGLQFYSLDAANAFLKRHSTGARCPVTNLPVATAQEVPSITKDPKAWFRLCDADGDRKLSRDEVVSALKAQLPLDNRAIDRFRTDDAAWRLWDADQSGFIEYIEIMDDDKGILKFVRDSFAKVASEAPIPDLRRDRDGWYRYWDEDESGELEFEEVVRAFAKTFQIDVEGISQLRESLSAVWTVFDTDNSGAVDRREFLARDGLADTVLATMNYREGAKAAELVWLSCRGNRIPQAGVQSLAEKFKLDERAAYKLSEVLSTKPNKKDVLKALDTHLAASNNPSALVMLKLADLRKDVPLGEVPYGTKGYRDRPYLGNYDRDGRRVGRAEANIGEGPPRDREKGDKGDRSADARAVGSDEDKATRKMAAMKEPAWEGLGTKPGIQVWRIEHFQVVPVDSTNHGQFHKGDSYIVLHSEQAADGKLLHTIFFYIGAESSSDEKGTAAYKTVELDDFLEGEPKQVREEMGKESPAFSALFPDLKYLDGGVDSGFKHVVPEGHDTKLYQVRKVKGKTSVLQVPVRKDMVNDSDSFVLDAADKIYVYDGPSASPFEKQAANRHAEHLESLRGGHAQATHDVDDTFWALMLLLLIGQTVSVVETANVTAIVAIVATAATAVTAVTAATATAIEIVATETGRRSAVSAATGTVIAVSVKLAHMAREVAIDRSGAAEAAVGGGAAAAELQPREVGAKHCHYLQLRSASACLSISFRAVGLHGMGYAMESEGGHPPGMEPASPRKASRCLAELLQSDEGQVHFLIKFLTQRGRSAASEMRNRLANDKPVQARGYHFKKEVIAEAVRCWQENEGQRTPKLSVPKTPASWTGGEGDGKPRLLRRLQVGRKQGTPKQVPVEQCRCLGSPWLWRTAAASTAVAAAAIGKRHRSDAHCAAREAARVDHSLTKEIRDEAGRDRRWDSVSRTTRRAMATGATDVDAVAILALLRSSLNPGRAETLLVQQFRPPVDCPTIELPAGLVDEGETAEEAALRELKEETGYIGTALTREGCMPIAGLHFLAVGLRLGLLQRFFSEPLSAPGKGEGRRVEESKVYVVPFLPFSREPEGEGGATLTRAWLEMAQARRKQTSWTMRRGYAGGGGGGGGAGFNSFSGVQLRASNRGRLDAEPADFDVDFSSSLEVDLGAGLGTGVQRDSFGFTSQPSGVLQGLEQMPFDHQIRAMRWRGDGVCCFILAGSGGIDAFRASRVLPHLLHLSTLSSGHLSQADLSGFRACVLLADLMDWPASEENAPDLVSACKELASNGSAVAVVAVFLSPIPGGPDRDAASTAALQNAVLGAGADCVLFSCPTHPVTCRHLQTAIQGTEAWHERIAEAIESAQAKLARAQEQRWQRHYQIALRKIVWKAPQTVFPHIPQEDGDLQEREDGVGDCSFVRVIGSGAFGSVFLGRHPRLGDVAVKAIKKASIKNIFDLAKVERELSILMGVLDHPNVLQILSCLHSTNNLYIVMEFLGEYTLHTYLQLRQSGSARNVVMLPFQEVQSIFGDMLKAIAHCHAAHVCHRDLKFKNMMIDANSRVTMVDFGLAVQVAPGQELHDSCGTVPFAAPEVMLCSPTKGYDGTVADTWSPDRTADQTSQAHPIKYSTWHGSTSNASSKQSMGGDWSIAVCLVELLCGLGTVESIIGLTADDEANFEHIAQQCLLLCTDYVHQLVLSYAGKDVQGVHRNDLVKTMRGVFRENPKSRMSVRDIGALEAFSAKAGPLPKAKKHRGENDDDERSSWTQSQYSYPKSGGSGEGDETLSDLSVTDWIGAEADQGIRPVQPLLERIGGSQTVVKVVSTVYDWLLPRTCMEKRPAVTQQNLRKMGRIRAGISSFLTELLEDHGKVDLDMLSNVHWNLGVSDFLFTDFADALLEAFRTWGSRGDSAMAEIQASIEKLRLPITAGHRARAFFLDLLQGCVATLRERERERNHKYPQQLTHSDPDSITVTGSVSTARKSEEIVWLMSALGIVAEDFAQALSDLLTQDARLEACLNETEKRDEDTNLATLHLTLWQGTIDAAMEVVFAGEQPLFQQDIGAVTLFCENVRQVLTETGLEDNDAKDMQVLMEHSGELVLNRARNARLVQPPSMAHDVQWFQKTMFDLCKADSYLQFFAECPKMELCLQSIFKLIMNGGTPPAGASFSSKLRSAHQDLYLTDARYSAFLAQVDKVLRAMFPWPVHPAAVANSNIRSLEGFRTEVLCGSTLRSSRLQAVEGMLNAGLDSSKQRVARNARKGRVMAAMQRCAGKLFGAISSDSRVSVFFRNTDPACKDRKAKYLGCAMGGSLPPAVTPSHTTPGATPGTTSPSSASSLPMSPTSSLKQQHQLFRISDYHFDVFLDHVRTALGGEDPEAADLAPAQLENLRQHVVLTSRARACPVSGNTASNGRACPFARRSNDGSAPLLDRVGGSEEIEKILAHMEREAASSSILVPFLQNQDELPCRIAIRNLLATAAAGDKLPEVDPQKLRDKHASLQMLPEHREKWLSCFNKSMVAHILPPEVAEKLQTCFQSLVSSMVGPTEAEQEDDAEEDRIAEERESAVDWGRLQGLMDELEGEKGLSKLIEAWYQRISEDPTINVFFTGTRPQVMMFQTREDSACSTPRSLGPSTQRLRPAPAQGLHTPEKVAATKKRPSSGGHEEATRKCQRADKEPTLSAGHWVSSPRPDDGKASGSVKELKPNLKQQLWPMPGLIETRDQEEQHLLTECYEGPSARSMVRDKQVLPKSRKVAYYVVALGMLILVVVCLRLWAFPAGLQAQMQSPPQQKYAIPPVPNKVGDHNGVEWPPMFVHGSEPMHFFIIGDWGGLDGFIDPPVGGKMVMYEGGNLPGPHVFAHRPSGCTDGQMSLCFNSHGAPGTCIPSCGYNESVDREPQYLVANQMKRRAAKTPPKFILNVGDNFYWGGIPIQCGAQPMAGVHWTTAHMFDTIFRQVYNSPELNNVVWFSVLGNHDYGGWLFTAGWDQQIAFTWHDQRWRLPAQFWKQHVAFPEQGFTIDILLTDSNVEDAVDPAARPTTSLERIYLRQMPSYACDVEEHLRLST
eukprot:s357_g26.t5